jgi:hypothetical protein
MQYMFFYIKKVTTTCVVLGDKYIGGDFGYGVLQVSLEEKHVFSTSLCD